jgi:hypothetical protein
MGILSVKGIKYITKEDYDNKVYHWQTIKLPIIGWICLILLNLLVPIIGGFWSYWVLDTYYTDYYIYNKSYYYCEKSDCRIKIDKIIYYIRSIMSKTFNWLFYKI